MAGLRGLIVRCGLTVLPLGMVILLCCLMLGWPGRTQAKDQLLSAPSAQAATVSSQNDSAAPQQVRQFSQPRQHQQGQQAAFERLHITHARIHVPN